MQIQNINYCYKYQNTSNKSFGCQIKISSLNNYMSEQKILIDKACSKLNKINLREYLTLTPAEKNVLRGELASIINPNTKIQILNSEIERHQYAAEAIRQCFDKEYGVGKYIVIAIGRSLSSISKLLGAKIGENNVKNIPLSNLSSIKTEGSNQLEEWNKYAYKEDYKYYLDSTGLSKNQIENSGKNYILLDYSFSGNSLKNAYKILTSDYFWGNKKRNISSVSIQELLPSGFGELRTELVNDLLKGNYKTYSFVDKLRRVNNSSILYAIDYNNYTNDYQKYTHKLFGFGLFDSEYEKKLGNKFKNLIFPNDMTMRVTGQKKRCWSNPYSQLKLDIFEDEYELDKAIMRAKNNPEKLLILNELKEAFERSKPLNFQYYITLRPTILNAISEI